MAKSLNPVPGIDLLLYGDCVLDAGRLKIPRDYIEEVKSYKKFVARMGLLA
jgi:hypothetical protein